MQAHTPDEPVDPALAMTQRSIAKLFRKTETNGAPNLTAIKLFNDTQCALPGLEEVRCIAQKQLGGDRPSERCEGRIDKSNLKFFLLEYLAKASDVQLTGDRLVAELRSIAIHIACRSHGKDKYLQEITEKILNATTVHRQRLGIDMQQPATHALQPPLVADLEEDIEMIDAHAPLAIEDVPFRAPRQDEVAVQLV